MVTWPEGRVAERLHSNLFVDVCSGDRRDFVEVHLGVRICPDLAHASPHALLDWGVVRAVLGSLDKTASPGLLKQRECAVL